MKSLLGLIALGGLGWFWLMLLSFGTLFGIAATVLWIWMLVEVLTRETDEGNTRLIWTLVIIFTHWLGAFIYLLTRRPERIRKLGR
jgi:hypothetical protein